MKHAFKVGDLVSPITSWVNSAKETYGVKAKRIIERELLNEVLRVISIDFEKYIEVEFIYKRGDKSSFLCNPNLITLADPGDYQELDLIKELSNGNVALIFDKNRDSVNQLIRVLKEAFPESNYKNNTHDKCNSIYERKYYYRGVKKDWMSSSSERAADDLKQIKLKHFITQLNNKQNEILRKNQQQECTRQKSFRVSRRKVKATSGSRFVGSEATNIRKRTRIRKSKISGRELLIN